MFIYLNNKYLVFTLFSNEFPTAPRRLSESGMLFVSIFHGVRYFATPHCILCGLFVIFFLT